MNTPKSPLPTAGATSDMGLFSADFLPSNYPDGLLGDWLHQPFDTTLGSRMVPNVPQPAPAAPITHPYAYYPAISPPQPYQAAPPPAPLPSPFEPITAHQAPQPPYPTPTSPRSPCQPSPFHPNGPLHPFSRPQQQQQNNPAYQSAAATTVTTHQYRTARYHPYGAYPPPSPSATATAATAAATIPAETTPPPPPPAPLRTSTGQKKRPHRIYKIDESTVDRADPKALKRYHNTLAARKSREKRDERVENLERRCTELEALVQFYRQRAGELGFVEEREEEGGRLVGQDVAGGRPGWDQLQQEQQQFVGPFNGGLFVNPLDVSFADVYPLAIPRGIEMVMGQGMGQGMDGSNGSTNNTNDDNNDDNRVVEEQDSEEEKDGGEGEEEMGGDPDEDFDEGSFRTALNEYLDAEEAIEGSESDSMME